jgi:hypothetical protein
LQRAWLPIALAVVFVVVAVFYLVPGVNHPLVSDQPTGVHVKHAILFGGLAVLSLIWARFAGNASH